MHKLSLLVLAALLVTACGTEGTKPTGSSVPKRDLTLSGQFAQVDVASPIELRRPFHQTALHGLRRMRQPTHPYEPTIIPTVLNTTPAPLAAKPAVEPVTTVSEPADPHELLPGRTITIIPVSNGSSSEGSRGDQPQTSTDHMGGRVGGHGGGVHVGGGCHGRGGRGGGSVPPAVLR